LHHETKDNLKTYRLRDRRVSNYARLDHPLNSKYQHDLKEAIQESMKDIRPDLGVLQGILRHMNLRMVDMPGDGNCFYYAVAHQIYGDINRQNEVRAAAVDYVANHPDEFSEFLDGKKIDQYVDLLSEDRNWAENLAIQATANAFGVTIEIINSNQDRYGGSRIIEPVTSSHDHRIVLGQIEQLHFVSTEIDSSFKIPSWGETTKDTGKKLINTCPIDGPLTWLGLTLDLFPWLQQFTEKAIVDVLKMFKDENSAGAKVSWIENVAKLPIERRQKKRSFDIYGSENELFFEPLQRNPLAKLEFRETCLSKKCISVTRQTSLPLSKSLRGLENNLQNAIEPTIDSCNICEDFSLSRSIEKLPPMLVLSKDHLEKSEDPPETLALRHLSKMITFVLVFISLKVTKNHFTALFRLGNSDTWIDYDGMRIPKTHLKNHSDNLLIQPPGTFVYIQETHLTSNPDSKSDKIKESRGKLILQRENLEEQQTLYLITVLLS